MICPDCKEDRMYVVFECLIPETFVRGVFTDKAKAEDALNLLKKENKRFGQGFYISQYIVGKIYKNYNGEGGEQ